MDASKPLEFLLHNSCPSIQYRTRKEILGENINTPIMLDLQNQILNDPNVKEVLSCQKEDGWLGGLFHQGDIMEPESGIRYLCEKGVNPQHPVIQQALAAMEARGREFDKGALEHVGKSLDDNHVGGSQMIKAYVFAYAGHEEEAFIKEQIKEALSGFEFVTTIHSIEEVYDEYKGKLVFKKDRVKWPSTYHLRLLALTYSWRNSENREMLINAFNKLVELSPIPEFKLLEKSQIIGPAHQCMNDFNVDLSQLKASEWMYWFHRTEMIARMGIANEIPAIKNQIQALLDILIEDEGFFTKSLSHFYFHKWSDYVGLALENDWKVKDRRISDLTFRSLLILSLCNLIDKMC